MKLESGTVLAQRYRAEALLGRGGMGEVWRCTDLEHGSTVAVKVVRDGSLDAETSRMFRDEVLATAHLRHPGIVVVYDVVRSGEDLALVMELRRGRPLSALSGQPFSVLRPSLLQVLEALAHAHARGVLHLDIKPGNILVDDGSDGVRATLLDFGIARAWRGGPTMAPRDDLIRGTLPYMAPEQLVPGFAALGPWTDLYAFGAMIHHLVTGEQLFARRHAADRILHPPPLLDATAHGAPAGLTSVLASLLQPRERDRPTHAADVLTALRELPDAPATRAVPQGSQGDDTPTLLDAHVGGLLPDSSSGPALAPPPPPASPPSELASNVGQIEAGTHALVGLKEPVLCGRGSARAQIWSELVSVRSEQCSRIVVVTGLAGMGKSRLARSALEDAHQYGLAHTAWTSWSESGAGNEGLRALLDNLMLTDGLTGEVLAARVGRFVERFPGHDDARFAREASRVLDGANPTAVDPDLAMRVTTQALRRAAARRAVAVWLDDVHSSHGVAQQLVERLRGEHAIAVVATSLEPTDMHADLHVELGPLERDDTRGLVQSVLDVDDDLVALIEQRSEGNPLLVTQLVAELVSNEAVERRSGKYSSRVGYNPESLPEHLDALWDARLARSEADPWLLGGLALTRPRVSEAVLDALAATLGPELRQSVERALRAGLLSRRAGALVWVHDSLRARVSARLPAVARGPLHEAAARALAVLVGTEDVQYERALHLYGAGRVEDACAVITEAIAWSHLRADEWARRVRSETLLDWATEAALPAHRARALAELAHAELGAGRAEQARTLVEEAKAAERTVGLGSAWVTWRDAQIARSENDHERARQTSLRALELAKAEENVEVESHVTGQLGLDAHRSRDAETARRLFEAAAQLARQRGDLGTEARALLHLGNIAPEQSLGAFDRAVELARQAADSRTELTAMQVRADALFLLGDRVRAAAEMREVAERARSLALRPFIVIVEVQLACWALWEHDGERAATHLDEALAAGAAEGSVVARCMSAAVGAAVAAMRGDAAAAQRCLEKLAESRGDYDEEELRRALRVGAEHARGDLVAAFALALGENTPPVAPG